MKQILEKINTKRTFSFTIMLLLLLTFSSCGNDNTPTPVDSDNDGVTSDTDPNDNNPCIPSATVAACKAVTDADNDGVNADTDIDDNDPCVPNANAVACQQPDNGFKITLRYIDNNLSAAKKQEVEMAVKRWEDIITADLPDVANLSIAANQCDDEGSNFFPMPFNGNVDDLQIDVATAKDDGPGNSLAFAGPCVQREDGRFLPVYGIMFIDIDDVNDPAFVGTIVHELGHVLGIGTMWEPPANDYLNFTGKDANTLCDDVNPKPNDLVYTAAKAVAAFQELGGVGNIPIENGEGQGSNCGHWRESFFGNELMDSSANAPDDPLSKMTIASMEDLGYAVDYSKAEAYVLPDCSPNCKINPERENWERVLMPKFSVSSAGELQSLRELK